MRKLLFILFCILSIHLKAQDSWDGSIGTTNTHLCSYKGVWGVSHEVHQVIYIYSNKLFYIYMDDPRAYSEIYITAPSKEYHLSGTSIVERSYQTQDGYIEVYKRDGRITLVKIYHPNYTDVFF